MTPTERIADLRERLDMKRKLLRIREIDTVRLEGENKQLRTDIERERTKWCRDAHENERLREAMAAAVTIIRQGKAQFTPNTTNSDVDVFLSRYDPTERDAI